VKRKRAKAKRQRRIRLIRLDIACGQRKEPGFVGIDKWDGPGVDIVHDLLEFPWPVKSGSVEQARCSHFFEHVPGAARFAFMDELHRVLAPGARCLFLVPYYSSMRAVQDPTHAWPPVCEASFLYFNAQWRKDNGLDHYPVSCDFDFSYAYVVDGNWSTRNEEARSFALRSYLNAATDLHVEVIKRA
jgi:hypothetical protein